MSYIKDRTLVTLAHIWGWFMLFKCLCVCTLRNQRNVFPRECSYFYGKGNLRLVEVCVWLAEVLEREGPVLPMLCLSWHLYLYPLLYLGAIAQSLGMLFQTRLCHLLPLWCVQDVVSVNISSLFNLNFISRLTNASFMLSEALGIKHNDTDIFSSCFLTSRVWNMFSCILYILFLWKLCFCNTFFSLIKLLLYVITYLLAFKPVKIFCSTSKV